MFAALANRKLYSVNCHLNMETSDFLGGLRPVRQKPNDKVCLVASVDMFIYLKNCEIGFLVEDLIQIYEYVHT